MASPTHTYGAPALGFHRLRAAYPIDTRNIAMPTMRTASGELNPVKPTSSARVKATLLDGATFAIETTKSPQRLTAFAFRPTVSWESVTAATEIPPCAGSSSGDRVRSSDWILVNILDFGSSSVN